jgi:hypothetical protein
MGRDAARACALLVARYKWSVRGIRRRDRNIAIEPAGRSAKNHPAIS